MLTTPLTASVTSDKQAPFVQLQMRAAKSLSIMVMIKRVQLRLFSADTVTQQQTNFS